jgi:hypothetical protein
MGTGTNGANEIIGAEEMSWVEIITVRTVGSAERKKALEVLEQMEAPKVAEEPLNIRIYLNTVLETDFSIHIHWSAETMHQCKSPLGLQLAQTLKDVGLTNHTVWVEGSGACR